MYCSQSDREVSEAYLVTGTPSAVLIANGVIDSPLATGQNDIQDLVTRATLPPRVEKGEAGAHSAPPRSRRGDRRAQVV